MATAVASPTETYMQVVTHVHTTYPSNTTCAGEQTLSDTLEQALFYGYRGIALAEHDEDPAQNPDNPQPVPSDDDRRRWVRERREIIASYRGSIDVWDGLECNLTREGELRTPPWLLKEVDYVLASQHGGLTKTRDVRDSEKNVADITGRIVRASSNDLVTGIAHPLRHNDDVSCYKNPREGVQWSRLMNHMRETNTIFELNFGSFIKGEGAPKLWDSLIRDAYNTGVPIVIGSDIHNAGMWAQVPQEESWHTSLFLQDAFLTLLANVGIPPAQVVNSGPKRFAEFLATPKQERGSIFSF